MLYPRGDEIAQMVGARVCCILLGETRLLKWYVPYCVQVVVFSAFHIDIYIYIYNRNVCLSVCPSRLEGGCRGRREEWDRKEGVNGE